MWPMYAAGLASTHQKVKRQSKIVQKSHQPALVSNQEGLREIRQVFKIGRRNSNCHRARLKAVAPTTNGWQDMYAQILGIPV